MTRSQLRKDNVMNWFLYLKMLYKDITERNRVCVFQMAVFVELSVKSAVFFSQKYSWSGVAIILLVMG